MRWKKLTGKKVLYYYIMGLYLLLSYYLAEYLGITTWAFVQPFWLLLLSLTIYYGTMLLLFDIVTRKIMGMIR